MRHVNRNTANDQSTTIILSRQEAVAILESCDERGVPKPFAIAFCTADEAKGTGGEFIRYERAVWHVKGGRVRKNSSFERIRPSKKKAKRTRSPWSRLIRGVDSDQLRKLHVFLILEINGQPVR